MNPAGIFGWFARRFGKAPTTRSLRAKARSRILAALDAMICFVSKCWRPVFYVAVSGGAVVNFIVIPAFTWTVPDLTAAAAYVAACVPLLAIRSWEKKHGLARGAAPVGKDQDT